MLNHRTSILKSREIRVRGDIPGFDIVGSYCLNWQEQNSNVQCNTRPYYKCPKLQMSKCPKRLQMSKTITNVQTYKSPKLQMSKLTKVQNYKCPNLQKSKITNVQIIKTISGYCDINNNKEECLQMSKITSVQNLTMFKLHIRNWNDFIWNSIMKFKVWNSLWVYLYRKI